MTKPEYTFKNDVLFKSVFHLVGKPVSVLLFAVFLVLMLSACATVQSNPTSVFRVYSQNMPTGGGWSDGAYFSIHSNSSDTKGLPDFSEITKISDGESALKYGLICDWTDVEALLTDVKHTAYPVEEFEEIESGQRPPPSNGIMGFRVYEAQDICYSVCMQYAGEDTERGGWVFAVLTGDRYKMENGLCCGMPVETAKTLINAYSTPYYVVNLPAADYNILEATASPYIDMLRLDQFPPGMFSDCDLAIAVPYTIPEEDFNAAGRVLCLYSKTGDTVDYITASLWGAS